MGWETGLTLKWVYGIMVMGRFSSHFLRLRSCREFFWVSCGVGSRELLMYRVFWVVLREGFRATLGEKGGFFYAEFSFDCIIVISFLMETLHLFTSDPESSSRRRAEHAPRHSWTPARVQRTKIPQCSLLQKCPPFSPAPFPHSTPHPSTSQYSNQGASPPLFHISDGLTTSSPLSQAWTPQLLQLQRSYPLINCLKLATTQQLRELRKYVVFP